ncbi:MAG: hypothetical protein AAGF49_10590 [Pseudomonadota bacterium]
MRLTRLLPTKTRGQRSTKRLEAHRASIAPLFDAHFYRTRYTDVATSGASALDHYIAHGWEEGRQPHPLFDAAWYLEENTDVREAGVEPLRHYMESGWSEERRPHVLFDVQKYARDYGVGKVSGQNPLLHYVQEGWALGHEPHALFKTTWYLCRNPDVAAEEKDPFSHYLTTGWQDGRQPHPAFDPAWYLERHQDVGRASPEPLVHYLKHGWRENRAPNEALDIKLRERAKPTLTNGMTPLEVLVTSDAYKRDNEPDLFDAPFYRTTYKDLAGRSDHALYRHFVTEGYASGRIGKAIRHRRVTAVPNNPGSGPRFRTPVRENTRPQYSAPLLIAGFHRSGTSMTANVLADAGLHVGDDLLGARPSNPYGHYEDLEILHFHDGLLRQSGQTWQTASDFPPILTRKDWRWMVNYGARKATFASWGFKDPRVCLFLPQWHATFPDMSLLYVYRPCIECVHSMRKRAARNFVDNKAPKLNFNFFRADDVTIRMYINYSHQALRFMEAFDGRMRVVALTDLLQNRDIVSEIRRDWGYRLADVLPFDVYDGESLTTAGPNEVIYDEALLEEVHRVERRFEALLS